MKTSFFSLLLALLFACQTEQAPETVVSKPAQSSPEQPTPPATNNLQDRFKTPEGFTRLAANPGSFTHYLRNFQLLPEGSPVLLYNGSPKNRQDVHAAVLDIDAGKGDLQQCADAVMRLRAEYLYSQKRYADIHFNFTNGFEARYDRWRKGERIKVSGNKVYWVQGGSNSESYQSFRQYLQMVFGYAGTASLSKELQSIALKDIEPGNVFIRGGFPGHAVLVMDVAENKTGERVFLLAQSYMPAQQIHVLKNFNNPGQSPWYSVEEAENLLETPEWDFTPDQLKRFGK
ncbi:MAG: DUF4846 domain-containing protein [Saprospiraceae bacterium]